MLLATRDRSSSALVSCAAMLVMLCCALTLPARFARAQVSDNEVILRRKEQEKFACELRYNDSLNREFYESANTNPNDDLEGFLLLGRIGRSITGRCVSIRTCPNAPVTWCVYLYHPVESISICYNDSGHVINMTEAAAQLRLQDKYQIRPQECTSIWPGCISLTSMEYFMAYSYLTCTAANETCYRQTDYKVDVTGSDEGFEAPNITFDDNKDLFFDQTNIFLCTSSLVADPLPLHYITWWESDGAPIADTVLNYNPYCGTRVSLSAEECFHADVNSERPRVRVHQFIYLRRDCPHGYVVQKEWLVIENATIEDTKKAYKCHSQRVIANPSFQVAASSAVFDIQPVYPLVDVVHIERPSFFANRSYPLNSDESFQWSCSVQAGVQDRLVWTHNGVEILAFDVDDVNNLTNVTDGVYNSSSVENITCSFVETIGNHRFVVSETKAVSRFYNQFTATLYICGTSQEIFGRYECGLRRAREDGEDLQIWSTTLSRSEDPGPDTTAAPIISPLTIIISVSVITSFVVIVFAVTIIVLCVKRQRPKKAQRTVWELAMGTMSVTDDILLEGFRRNNSMMKKDSLGPSTVEEKDPLEFPRNKLILLERILGEGTFGVVRQARAEGIVESTPGRNIVAVKTTKPKAPPHELSSFWEELELMKNMAPHENLVNLLGYCTSPGGPTYMIIEYANHGSLKDFLKSCEEAVTKLNHKPQLQIYRSQRMSSASTCSTTCSQQASRQPVSAQNSVFSNISTPTTVTTAASLSSKFDFSSSATLPDSITRERLITQDSGFFGESASQATFNDVLAITPTSNMAHTIAPLTHDYVNSKGLLYMEDIQNFALQIACGLRHLEDIEIVHCDLAARNILIAEGFVLKIGDFGMARDVSEKEYYRKQGGRIPVKWTAPEALQDHTFSYKSDIWSFGVILWEIFTYGQQPYSKFKIRQSWEPFVQYLMEGNRLTQPDGCPNNFYNLMQRCWETCPSRRPSAEDLVQLLSQANLLYEDCQTDGDSEDSSHQEDSTCDCNSRKETQV